MKKVIFLSSLFVFLILRVSYAEVIWQEDFNGFTQNWICCLADCAVTPGVPPGYTEFHSNTLGLNYGACNTQITTDAHRGTPGPNNRGFRMYLEQDVFPTGENVLKKDLGANYTLLYIRWYQRDSTNNYTNFQKLFRLKQSSGQIMIPEWQINGNAIQMNLWDANTGNHFFSGYNLKTNYTPNTWVCYEIMIDIVNKKAQFWVNGVSKGSFTNSGWSSNWYIRNIEIGGNQYGHPWQKPVEQYIDYDDIVVSTSYVGPDAGTIPPPNLPVCVSDAAGLQAALTAAQSNGADDIIEVVQGTYTGNFTYSSSEGRYITLLGGFSTGCVSRVVDPANTVLDGNGSGLVLGLYNNNGGDIFVEGFTIQHGNNGNGVGGVDTWTTGNITLTTNIITGNISSGAPGGVFAESGSADSDTAGDVTLINNIVAANTATSGQGGGVAAWSHSKGTAGTVTLVNNTCTGNTADNGGGAYLGVSGSSGGTINCYNNIIWGNTAQTSGRDIYLYGAGTANGYNNDYTNMAGSWTNSGNNINADPLFDGSGNYHLRPDSPCIDTGNNSAPDLPATDFEGDDRVIDGNYDSTASADMGADEYNGLLVAETPPDGAIFETWALINKYQPSFQWIAVEPFKSFVILFSTSDTDFSTKGVLITKGSISGTKSSWTPPIATWKKIMAASYNSGSIRDIYWKVVGTKADKTTAESLVRYLSIDDPIPPVIQSPAGGAILLAGTRPTFIFDTNCNVKFRLEISSLMDFSDPKKTKIFAYTVKDPNVTTTLAKTLSSSQWKAVKTLIGTGTGYFRIRAWDGINRETASSETRSFTIQY